MKKPIYLVIIVFGLLFLSMNVKAEETKIVCTNSALADFTNNIITENVTVEYIMPSGVCPAYYDTVPSDVDKILKADIIISFGDSFMEPWLADLLTYNTDYTIIECKDMGEWNIPTGAKTYVEYLEDQLSEILPEQNSTIKQNAESYLNEIDEKSVELKELIQNNNMVGKEVICMQWQEDFLEFIGLNVTYSYGPPQGLSVQDELDVINAASKNDICAVIDNLQSGTDFGARVASESGASHVIFTNFPDAIPGTKTYLDMITYNTEQLIQGIETYEYKQGDISNLQTQIDELEFQRNSAIVFVIIFAILAIILFAMYKKK